MLTLFGDLLHNFDTQNPHSERANVENSDSCPSDSESGVSGTDSNEHRSRPFCNNLSAVSNGEAIYEVVTKKLVSSLSSCGFNAEVEAVYRNDYTGIMSRAKLQSFCIYSKAMEVKCGGNSNVKYAWYGASKNEIRRIVSHGFGLPVDTQTHGQGVYLSPVDRPFESMKSASPDEDGLRHMLLCRVILGKIEAVPRFSEQCNPSCEEFDSGVDDLASPSKYIVWSSCMNTHILPEFVISFRASSYGRGDQRRSQSSRTPNSDWMPFPTLITTLSKFLPRDAIELIGKNHSDYKNRKITRQELIQLVRNVAGDKLLMAIIKSYRRKQIKQPSSNGLYNN
ncbi:hypothetical protein ABFS82_04G170000 [Erythranthe guttata]|nr:PREDICTED: probable inactive poly [ADP-ribose] polymerase SRO5 isoform X1 [Erythranthe guttata]|eukprot:XP_012829283.1 PREDICTED: probable inactive poly [ADP-ribose] polymerase SRO5 isoform X1 [Erythranthe guttata]